MWSKKAGKIDKLANFEEGREDVMFEQLRTIIVKYVEVKEEDITPESRFMEDLGFTSFDFMSMLGELEDEFDIEVDEQEAAGIRTVGEAVAYLEKLKEEA